MDPKEIKIEFIRKGITQTSVAEQVGRSPSMVQRVIARKVVSRPVAKGIADALGMDLLEVFPELDKCRRCAACS
jgi:transcriptional regulator with XRE-family HTH domain